MPTRPSSRALAVLLVLIVLPLVSGCDTGEGDAETSVTVMTRNLYLGGDLFLLLAAETPEQVPALAGELYFGSVVQSNVPERMGAIAAEIEANDPDLVGLQEVSLYRTQTPSDYLTGNTEPNAETVSFDFLEILLDSLAARGLDYDTVSVNVNADVELPATTNGTTFTDVRLTDRDVILVRSGLSAGSPVERTFGVNASVPVGGIEIEFTRGYQYVDVTKDGVAFTFANTHLEVGGEAVSAQVIQASTLTSDAGLGDLSPLILAGDFNSDPEDPGDDGDSYRLLTGTFDDAWTALRESDDGPTCCFGPLLNPATDATLEERIDLILYRGDVTAAAVGIVGDDPAEQTPGGLWPSDHAGVVATLTVRN